MSSFRRRGNARRRRGLARQTSSSRRLSSIVNPDLLNDVAFHTIDEFSRQAPARRHSIVGVFPKLGIAMPSPRTRAASEKLGIHVSTSDAAALMDEWKQNERKQGKRIGGMGLEEVPEDDGEEEEEESDDEHETSTSSSLSSSLGGGVLVAGVFLGYVLSSAGLQKLNSLRPGCGQLVTLLQYIATIGEKSPNARTYVYSPVLPLKWHALFVVLMFLSVQMANASLGAGLPFGLFLVIKNTNLVFSLLLGLASGRSFTIGQIMSIAVITTGIMVCVMAQNLSDGASGDTDTVEAKGNTAVRDDYIVNNGFIVGATLATASTFCMALLGQIQENIFARYKDDGDGQECGESLFFTHLLGLPLFCVGDGPESMRDDISGLLKTPGITIAMLSLNILATLAVKQCFVGLLEEGRSLTATLAITVARMTGVVLSEIMATVFGQGDSSANLFFWFGGTLVAGGSLAYATGGRFCKLVRRRR